MGLQTNTVEKILQEHLDQFEERLQIKFLGKMKIYDVFLSYRRSDGFKSAYEIYKYLTAKGLRVF